MQTKAHFLRRPGGVVVIDPETEGKTFVFPGISDCRLPPKPKLLFVDDRTKRIEYAQKEYGKMYDVTIATNVPEALRQLSARDWAVVSLDHDLMGHDFEDPETPTCGMEIARYIIKCGWPPQRKMPDFWIHSFNLFAAHLMVVTLMEAGFNAWYKPIIYKTENIRYDDKGNPI